MAVITNTITAADIDKAISIDFTNRFGGDMAKILEALGVTRKIPVASGSRLNTYKTTATMAASNAAEGDEISLSKINIEEGDPIILTLQKYRKLVTAEAIQRSGFDVAVEQTDAKLIKEIQKAVRAQFFDILATGTGTEAGATFQAALAKAWGIVQTAFEDDGVGTVTFVNPSDASDYLGNASISLQDAFGLKYAESFLDTTLFLSSLVPAGTVYATAPENIVLAYVDVNGELAKGFALTADESGYIGVVRTPATSRASLETVAMSGIALYPEVLAGVAKVAIGGADG